MPCCRSDFLYATLGLPARGGTQFKQVLCEGLWVDFNAIFSIFFRRDCFVRCTTWFSFMSSGGATIFAKLPSKITKSPKIGGKVRAHHFVQIAERFEENSTAVIQGRQCICAPIYFSTCRYIAQQFSKFVQVVHKRLGMNKVVRAKSHTESKFSNIFFEPLYAGWTVVVHLCCGFLCGVRWRHKRAPNLEPRFLVNFVPV